MSELTYDLTLSCRDRRLLRGIVRAGGMVRLRRTWMMAARGTRLPSCSYAQLRRYQIMERRGMVTVQYGETEYVIRLGPMADLLMERGII
jgi:hypothetical protein